MLFPEHVPVVRIEVCSWIVPPSRLQKAGHSYVTGLAAEFFGWIVHCIFFYKIHMVKYSNY